MRYRVNIKKTEEGCAVVNHLRAINALLFIKMILYNGDNLAMEGKISEV